MMKNKGKLGSGREWEIRSGEVMYRAFIVDEGDTFHDEGDLVRHVRGGRAFRTDEDEACGLVSRLEPSETEELDALLAQIEAEKARILAALGAERKSPLDLFFSIAKGPKGGPKADVTKYFKGLGNGTVRVCYAIDTGWGTVMRDGRVHTEWVDYRATDEELWEREIAPFLAELSRALDDHERWG